MARTQWAAPGLKAQLLDDVTCLLHCGCGLNLATLSKAWVSVHGHVSVAEMKAVLIPSSSWIQSLHHVVGACPWSHCNTWTSLHRDARVEL